MPDTSQKAQGNASWPEAIRDIVMFAMARGQGLMAMLFILSLVVAWRLPPERLADVTDTLLGGLADYSGLGWLLATLLAIGWAINVSIVVKTKNAEFERMAKEKSEWQAGALDGDTESSTDV